MKNPPCHNCGKRTVEPNCHDMCKEYLDWKNGNAVTNSNKMKFYEDLSYTIKAYDRMRRLRRHGK